MIKTPANTSIPKLRAAYNLPALPQRIRILIQARNYTRRRYQRTRNSALWGILQLLNHWTATSLTAYRNSQWESFLHTLKPYQNHMWRVVRYFTKKKG